MQNIDGVVDIPNIGLFCKSEEAKAKAIVYLLEHSYEIKDNYATLKYERVGKCGSCGQYINTLGIACHGHVCEKCGAITQLEYIKGEFIHFRFWDAPGELHMKIYGYDQKAEEMLVYPDPLESRKFFAPSVAQQLQTLKQNRKLYRVIGGPSRGMRKHIRRLKSQGLEVPVCKPRMLAFKKKLHGEGVINICDVGRGKCNYRVVKLWEGKEYGEWDKLPVGESYSIRVQPVLPRSTKNLHETILHAAGAVSRTDYYYQDGRAAFFGVMWERMRLFVEHFTTIDIAEWDEFITVCSKSGPGFIKDLSAFCGNCFVRTEPNAFATVCGMIDIMNGSRLTTDFLEVASVTMKSAKEVKTIKEILRHDNNAR